MELQSIDLTTLQRKGISKEQIEELLHLSSDKNDAEKITRVIRHKKQEAKRNLESPIRYNNLNRM